MNEKITDGENMITILLNGESIKIRKSIKLSELLVNKNIVADQVATSVNNGFIPRSERISCILNDGDSVLCFEAIVGG